MRATARLGSILCITVLRFSCDNAPRSSRLNRVQLQQLAEDRTLDSQSLLAAGRWSAAYYLIGYAVECGLKACVLNHIVNSGVVFQDRKYAERCWTHRPEELVKLANLEMREDWLLPPIRFLPRTG